MDIKELIMRDELPNKKFFKLSELASHLKVKVNDLLCWEREFSNIKAKKSRSGKKIYSKNDATKFFIIKKLVQDKKFTIAAAQKIVLESDEFNNKSATVNESDSQMGSTVQDEKDSMPLKKDNIELLDKSKEEAQDPLKEAALILGDKESECFDEKAYEIHQKCSEQMEELEEVVASEEIDESNDEEMHNEESKNDSMQLDFQKTMGTLKAQRESLTELLEAIKKYEKKSLFKDTPRASE